MFSSSLEKESSSLEKESSSLQFHQTYTLWYSCNKLDQCHNVPIFNVLPSKGTPVHFGTGVHFASRFLVDIPGV